MFSREFLRYRLESGRFHPAYLGDEAQDLVRRLLLVHESLAGTRYGELFAVRERQTQFQGADPRVFAGLCAVIEERMDLLLEAPVAPRRIREILFPLARREADLPEAEILARAGAELGKPISSPSMHLYGDLRSEKVVRYPDGLPSPHEAIARYNLRLLQGLLLHSDRVRLEVHDQLRAVWRFARLQGLIIEMKGARDDETVRLEITGPLSIFRQTRKYGRALARFLPACCVASRYRLEADIRLGEREGTLVVTAADRVLSTHRPPSLFDSKVEERFYRDFLRLGSAWEASREAEPVQTPSGVFFPDFSFRHRAEPGLRVELEIVGFWTRDYLERKRLLMRQLKDRRTILCVDRRLACDDLEGVENCLFYRGRVPAGEVLTMLETFRALKPGAPK